MHIKKIFILIFIFFLLTPSVVPARATSNFLQNPERSNYTPGHGNITYPVITHTSSEGWFSRNIAVGDVNEDGKKEIIGLIAFPQYQYCHIPNAASIDNTLYVYSSNLSLLWKYKITDPMVKTYSGCDNSTTDWKVHSLALGDLDRDGSDEIIFSISPCIGYPFESIQPETVLHVLKGDGTELWNRTFEGGITSESLAVADINGDGRNEIIVGCKNLYILDSNGQILSSYSPDNYTYRGISELAVHGKEIVFTFWYYKETGADSVYKMEKVGYETNSLHRIWSLQFANGTVYSDFFTAGDFSIAYIQRTYPYPNGIVGINLTDGEIAWQNNNDYGALPAVLPDGVIWNTGYEIYVLNKSGKVMASVQSDHRELWSTISVFDVNNDGTDDVVVVYRNGIEFYSLPDLKKELDVGIWKNPGNIYPFPVILHSDIDNEGFDEIITANPEGKIVIIDNGTPPAPPPPEENKFPVNELIIAGTGIIGAVALITVVLWKKQKRRKSQ